MAVNTDKTDNSVLILMVSKSKFTTLSDSQKYLNVVMTGITLEHPLMKEPSEYKLTASKRAAS